MTAARPSPRAIFLDRDGTLIYDPGYLSDPERVRLLDGVGAGLRALAALGFRFVIVTNQSGIARGRYTVPEYERVARRVAECLAAEQIELAGAYYCPYHPDGSVPPFNTDHADRKPSDGMWQRAAAELGIDLTRSYSIGDGERDVVAGKRAGTRAVLLAGGRDKWPLPVQGPYDADFVARDFREAVVWILLQEQAKLPEAPGGALLA